VLRRLFQNRPELKSPRELGLMREAGKVVAAALRLARARLLPRLENNRNQWVREAPIRW
jgi:Xaa-Pro aminopeptidase